MSFTPEQKRIVQTTFAQVTDTNLMTIRFYSHLFEIDPSTEPLFKGDLLEQRLKLFQTLATIIKY